MNPKLARFLTLLYPLSWRRRYGAEFCAFLEELPVRLSVLINVAAQAAVQRFRTWGNAAMTNFQKSIVLTAYAYLAAVAAGVNLCAITDDSPLVAAMRSTSSFAAAWTTIEIGSVIALAAVLAIAIPAAATALRFALSARRMDVILRLATPFVSAAVLLAWTAGVLRWNGHWAAFPWAIAGDWKAPVNWPPLETRWILGSITFAIMIAGLMGSAIAVRQAIARSGLSPAGVKFARPATMAVAVSIVAMAIGVLGWGLFANAYAPNAFHAHGGLFGTTIAVSWMASFIAFAASSVVAIRAIRVIRG